MMSQSNAQALPGTSCHYYLLTAYLLPLLLLQAGDERLASQGPHAVLLVVAITFKLVLPCFAVLDDRTEEVHCTPSR